MPPATDSDGVSDDPDALPEGARLLLDPDLDLDAVPLLDHERPIAAAPQECGMILVDDSSNGVGFYATDPKSVAGDPYDGVLPSDDWPILPNIPVDALRVLEKGPQDGGFQDALSPYDSGCGHCR